MTNKANWQQLSIGQLGRVVTGKTPPTARPELFGNIYPFITPTDIDWVSRKIKTERFLSDEGRNFQKNLLLPPKTICFVCIGATIGKMCLIDNPSFTNQQINSVIVKEKYFDPLFIYYALKHISPNVKTLAGGAATPIINKTTFSDIYVSIPPLLIQSRIASILSTYDDLIENNTRRIAVLEEMARRIYEEWFVHFRFPGHEKVKMVDSELGKIPEGWKINVLGKLASDIRQAVQPNMIDPETPYVGLEHIPRRSIALSEWGQASDVQSTKIVFQERDILFGKIRPYFHKVAVAPINGVTSSDSIVIRTVNEDFYALVLATVSSDAFVAHATQTSNGTKMPRANWNVLIQYPIAMPPKPLLSQFNSFITDIVAATKNFTLRNRNLRTTRDFLLPKLISGEIDVSQLPEPQEAAA